MNIAFTPDYWSRRIPAAILAAAAGIYLAAASAGQAQKIYSENFDELALGPNVEEASQGEHVWTKTAPTGWVIDDSLMPGYGTPDYAANDGRREWAGWAFADVKWWPTVDNQRRSEFVLASGAAAIADPDEWDDAPHLPGLYNSYLSSPSFSVAGKEANSLVIAFDSSWRPEAHDDGAPNFPIDENGSPTNNQTAVITVQYDNGAEQQIMHWSSVSGDADFHDHTPNESIILALNNPAGAAVAKLKFGLLYAADDWWWAFDNLAVGEPPLVTGITATGRGFTLKLAEALGKTVKESAGITAKLDGQTVTVTAAREEDKVLVNYDQSPKIFVPGSKHSVEVTFTTGAGKTVVDTAEFTAPTYCGVSATPMVVTAAIAEKDYLMVDETKDVQLELDGTAIPSQSVTRVEIADAPDRIEVKYTPAAPFASASSHTLKITFTTTTAQPVVETVAFAAPAYATLPASLGTAAGTGANAGMKWRTHQLDSRSGSTIAIAEDQLAGKLGASVHDPSAQAAGGYFEINYVNFDKNGGDAGNFYSTGANELAVPDELVPGIAGLNGSGDYYACEALAYLEIPQVGMYSMVVNSDDGFQVSMGNASNPAFLVLGKCDSTRGQADTRFYFKAEKPGVYLFRLLYYNGTGDARVEWFTLNPDGSAALVNGTQTGALKSYRKRTVAEPDLVAGGIQSVALNAGQVIIHFTGTLKAAAQVTGPFATVAGVASPYSTPPSGGPRFFIAE